MNFKSDSQRRAAFYNISHGQLNRFARKNMFAAGSDIEMQEYLKELPAETVLKDVAIEKERENRGDIMAANYIGSIPTVLTPFEIPGVNIANVAETMPLRGWAVGGGIGGKFKSSLAEDYQRQLKEKERVKELNRRLVQKEIRSDVEQRHYGGREAKARAETAEEQKQLIADLSDKARQRYNIPKKRTNPYHFNIRVGY